MMDRLHDFERGLRFRLAGPVRARLAVCLGQLALMLRSGISVGESIAILVEQTEHPQLREALEGVETMVCSHGWRLSQAMEKFPDVFPPYAVMMTRSGEESGSLDARLLRASQLLERTEHLRNRVKGALTSPLMTAGASLLVLLFVVKFVLPKFVSLYASMEMEFPFITRIMLAIVSFFDHPLTLFAGGCFLAAAYLSRVQIRHALFELAVRTPWVKNIVGSFLGAEFCEIVAFLYRDGVPIDRVLAMMARSAENPMHRANLENMLRTLQATGDFSRALLEVPYFPATVSGMATVAEESGDLYRMLKAVGNLMEQKNEMLLFQLVTLIEPLTIAFLGVVMGFFFIAMFVPVYGMLNQMG